MKMFKIVCVSVACVSLFGGCVGKVVALPFKVVGDVVETVLP